MEKKKEILDYIREYTSSDDTKKIINLNYIINKEGFDIWSFKKLIFLEYYLKLYLLILSDKYKSKCYFIDFFSSCGANKIEKGNIKSIGSPIISLLKGVIPNKKKNMNNRFFNWIFMEIDPTFCDVLKKRVEKTCEIIKEKTNEDLKIDKDIKIICGDSNNLIDDLVLELEKESKTERIAVLAFIDPYRFSAIEWQSVKKLLSLKYVDIIFTLSTGTLRRGVDICKEKEKFLSPSLLKECSNKKFCDIPEEKIGDLYAKDIFDVVGRGINFFRKGISVRNSVNTEIYRIELFSHSKKAVEIAESIAKKLDKLDYSTLSKLLDQTKGQPSLKKWF